MSNPRLFLCTDLDRTLLPNGPQPESPQARTLFTQLIEHESVTLAYVTGRHRELVEAAIQTWQIPVPDFVITDVGTCIHRLQNGHWQKQPQWEQRIDSDWAGQSWQTLHGVLQDLDGLQLQEPEKQNRHKLSYYVPLQVEAGKLEREIRQRLAVLDIDITLVWSIDEQAATGLLDILPRSAGKLAAVHFLMDQLGYQTAETVFAGDSGNDLEVLTSDIPAVLVANASPEVREMALTASNRAGTRNALYLAQGGFMGMNGNYSAGIIEGVIHYRPELQDWLAPNGVAQ